MFIVETRSLPTMFPVRGSRTGTLRIPTPACGVSMAERNLDISAPVGVLLVGTVTLKLLISRSGFFSRASCNLPLRRLASPSNLF